MRIFGQKDDYLSQDSQLPRGHVHLHSMQAIPSQTLTHQTIGCSGIHLHAVFIKLLKFHPNAVWLKFQTSSVLLDQGFPGQCHSAQPSYTRSPTKVKMLDYRLSQLQVNTQLLISPWPEIKLVEQVIRNRWAWQKILEATDTSDRSWKKLRIVPGGCLDFTGR